VNRPPVLAGTVLIAVGALLLLEEFGALDAGRFIATWWPLAVIAAGVLRWVRVPRSLGGGALLVIAGLVLQLWRLEVIDDLSLLWPALLLTLGVWLITGRAIRVGSWRHGATVVDGEGFETVTVFGDRHTRVRPGSFSGGSVVTVFGDADVDLTPASLAGTAEIDGLTVFGDVDLLVPPGWQVTSAGLTIFGDVDIAPPWPEAESDGPTPELRLDLVTVFGDVTVRRGVTSSAPTSAASDRVAP
jgi:predicted membrane protein